MYYFFINTPPRYKNKALAMSEEQKDSMVIHKCDCCRQTRKMYANGKCFHCTHNCDEPCLNKIEPKAPVMIKVQEVKEQEIDVTIEEIQERINSGKATKRDWHLKRLILAKRNMHNRVGGDSEYTGRNA